MKAFETEADVHFGDADNPPADWRAAGAAGGEDPDDELLDETPADVVAVLGFDPLELLTDEDVETAKGEKWFDLFEKHNPYHDSLGRFTTGPGGGMSAPDRATGGGGVSSAPKASKSTTRAAEELTGESGEGAVQMIAEIAGIPDADKVFVMNAWKKGGVVRHLRCSIDNEDVGGTFHVIKGDDGYKLIVEHFRSKIEGAGMGRESVANMVRGAAKHNVKSIVLEGARGEGYNGYYSWPRLGFDGPLDSKNLFTNEELLTAVSSKFPKAKRVSDLMKTPDGRDWWKKNGDHIMLQFDPSPKSLNRRVFDAYYKAKTGRKVA